MSEKNQNFTRVEYVSSEEEIEEKIEEQENIKINKNFHTWIFNQEFESSDLAQAWIEEQQNWSKMYYRDSREGGKQYYRCNLVPARSKKQCAAEEHTHCHLHTNKIDSVSPI